VKLGDTNLALVGAFNAVCCLAVLLLAAYKRASASLRLMVPDQQQTIGRAVLLQRQ
jgi:hypothetical protein